MTRVAGPAAPSDHRRGAARPAPPDGVRPARPGAVGLAFALLLVFAGLVGTVGLAGLSATPAVASGQGGRAITRYDVVARAGVDGTTDVTITFDFDFADTPGHGPFVTLPITQAIEGDAAHVRSYPITDVSVVSPTGAPSDVSLEDTGTWLNIRIGNPDISDVSGVQTYVLHYTLRGMVNPGAGAAGEDEFFWNVIGDAWEIPLSNLSVTLTGPADVLDTICFAGPSGGTAPCTSHGATGPTATFTQASLNPFEPFTIDASFPAGTFVGAEPILIATPQPRSPFALTPATGGLGALILAVGSLFVIRRSNQRGRDEQFLGLTPGLAPVPGQVADVGRADKRLPIAVQFTPPAGVRPGLMGTLTDETADPRDVTATIIDLAVRGYLRIEEVAPPGARGGGDWNLRVLSGQLAGLAPYERELLDSLFAGRTVVTLSAIKTTFSQAMARVQVKLYTEVTTLGWFRDNPDAVRSRWALAGVGIGALGGVLTFILAAATSWALVGVSIIALGIVVLALSRRAPARTAAGTAVLAQSLGFKRYLETAEANQLRFEEGEDLFSRYLPFAIVFGVAERWAGIFEQLARQGRAVAEPTWYVGPYFGPGHFWLGGAHFGQAMNAFSETASATIAAPTPGSSGGSGFSGGFSGGGGGGGGGGGW